MNTHNKEGPHDSADGDQSQLPNSRGDIKTGDIKAKTVVIGHSSKLVINEAVDGDERAELNELITKLRSELDKVSEQHVEDVKLVAHFAEAAIEELNRKKPNQKMLQITGESLKKAAENLASVAPIAARIAIQLLRLGNSA